MRKLVLELPNNMFTKYYPDWETYTIDVPNKIIKKIIFMPKISSPIIPMVYGLYGRYESLFSTE